MGDALLLRLPLAQPWRGLARLGMSARIQTRLQHNSPRLQASRLVQRSGGKPAAPAHVQRKLVKKASFLESEWGGGPGGDGEDSLAAGLLSRAAQLVCSQPVT